MFKRNENIFIKNYERIFGDDGNVFYFDYKWFILFVKVYFFKVFENLFYLIFLFWVMWLEMGEGLYIRIDNEV